MAKVTAVIESNGVITVDFQGRHFSKRQLLQLIKAIKLEYRRRRHLYRRDMLAKAAVNVKRAEDRKLETKNENLGVKNDAKHSVTK